MPNPLSVTIHNLKNNNNLVYKTGCRHVFLFRKPMGLGLDLAQESPEIADSQQRVKPI